MPDFVQCQIGRDDEGFPATVAAVYDVVDLFQRILRTALHPEIVNDEQWILKPRKLFQESFGEELLRIFRIV